MSHEVVEVKELLVIRVPQGVAFEDWDALLDLGAQLHEETGKRVLVLGGDASISSLDEDMMRAEGWVRAKDETPSH